MKKRFYYGAMATGLVFTACSSETLSEPDNNRPTEADQTLYVKMAIHGDDLNGTRAITDNGNPVAEDNFEAGKGDESVIRNAYFVFYDKNNQQVGDIVQITLDDTTLGTGTNGPTVEKYYESVVPVTINKGDLNPAKVVCYINPISPASLQNPLSEIQTVTRDMVVSGSENKLFPMSNSVYYASDSSIEPEIAVPVSAALYETEAEAKEEGAEAVDVYVERYASKLKFQSTTPTDYTTHAINSENGNEQDVVLSFEAKKWALNAESNKTYVVKSFREEAKEGPGILPTNYTYTALNTVINVGLENNGWEWNNATYHRSYWGMSPAYFTGTYPEVASDITSNPESVNQKYYSYSEVEAKGYDVEDQTVSEPTPRYFKETTVGTTALKSSNPAAAMPSVILVGQYKLTVNGVEVPENTDFYTYLNGSDGKPLVYFANATNSANSVVNGSVSMLRRFLDQVTVLYKKEGNNYVRLDPANSGDLTTMVRALTIAKPEDDVLKDPVAEAKPMKVAARRRTLQFNPEGTITNIYIANGNGYKEVVADDTDNPNSNQITVTAANRVLMQQVGFANYYNAGKAYFNIPVKHYGWYRAGNEQKDNTGDIDWSKVRVGDFGMVRNHSYSINVNSITGLATGIGGVTDPIVPPAETKDYYVAYKVRILKWAVVPVQNVDL